MSAFLVGNRHITAMLNSLYPRYPGDAMSYRHNNEYHPCGGNHHKMGQILAKQNHRSVTYRYQDNPDIVAAFVPFRSDPTVPTLSPVAVLKACHCYRYQSCETPDYDETEAAAICNYIETRAMRNLPGYDDAKSWPVY